MGILRDYSLGLPACGHSYPASKHIVATKLFFACKLPWEMLYVKTTLPHTDSINVQALMTRNENVCPKPMDLGKPSAGTEVASLDASVFSNVLWSKPESSRTFQSEFRGLPEVMLAHQHYANILFNPPNLRFLCLVGDCSISQTHLWVFANQTHNQHSPLSLSP